MGYLFVPGFFVHDELMVLLIVEGDGLVEGRAAAVEDAHRLSRTRLRMVSGRSIR